MESRNTKDSEEAADHFSEEELDYDELTSHKIDKNVLSQKKKKKMIVILEHA